MEFPDIVNRPLDHFSKIATLSIIKKFRRFSTHFVNTYTFTLGHFQLYSQIGFVSPVPPNITVDLHIFEFQ